MAGRVLIVDDVAANRIIMKVKLEAAGYIPVVAASGATCLAVCARDVPDLILMDASLPDMPGVDLLRRLRADAATSAVPIVMLTANRSDDQRVAAFRAGADEFFYKPLDDQILLARIRHFMRARDQIEEFEGSNKTATALYGLAEAAPVFHAPGTVAIVAQRSDTAMRLRRMIAAHLTDHVVIMTGDEALTEGLKSGPAPDVFLIEADVGGAAGGLRLMSELRSRTNTRHAAISILVPDAAHAGVAMAFDLGANDVVSAALCPEEIALRLSRQFLHKREADAKRASVQDGLRLAMIDPLTGLHNRRYGIAQLSAIAERSHKDGSGFAVMVVDLDRFKSVNDRWGHAAGDAVLVEVADRLARNLRCGDLLARIGGEEFLIALPDTALPEARIIADRLCQAVQQEAVWLADTIQIRVTVSIGLAINMGAAVPTFGDGVSDIVDRADQALLISKSEGRNQVTISQNAA